MSNKQHDKQLDRARKKRNDSKFDRRASRNRVVILIMAGLMVLSLVGAALTSALSGSNSDTAPDPADDPVAADQGPGPCGEAPDDVPEVDSRIYDEPFERSIDTDASYVATIATTCGDIVMELDVDNAPTASNNLVNLAQDGYYEGVVFHRVIPGFVIQAGDPLGTGCGQEDCGAGFDPDAPSFPGYEFEDELDTAETLYEQVRQDGIDQLRAAVEAEGDDFDEEVDDELLAQLPGGYPRGTVAMANAGPDTNGSQFYIAQGDPTALPGPQFTVLGTVIEGMDIVDAIAASPTDATDRPIEAVSIRDITVEQR